MKILINNFNGETLETISHKNLNNLEETFKKISSMKGSLEINFFAINMKITSNQLSKLKDNFNKINIYSFCIYSNHRDTIIAGKSLKIDSTFIKEQEVKNKFLLLNSQKKEDILHEGTVRSGDRISSFTFVSSRRNLFLISCSLIKVESIFRDLPAIIVSL